MENDKVVNVAFERKLTLFERWCNWLFPYKHCFAPDAPSEFKDCLTVHSITKLDFADRIRVLFTGIVCVTCRTVTENEIGRTVTGSNCYIGTAGRDLKEVS